MYIVALLMYTHTLDLQRIKLVLYILFTVIQLYAKNIVIFDMGQAQHSLGLVELSCLVLGLLQKLCFANYEYYSQIPSLL